MSIISNSIFGGDMIYIGGGLMTVFFVIVLIMSILTENTRYKSRYFDIFIFLIVIFVMIVIYKVMMIL